MRSSRHTRTVLQRGFARPECRRRRLADGGQLDGGLALACCVATVDCSRASSAADGDAEAVAQVFD